MIRMRGKGVAVTFRREVLEAQSSDWLGVIEIASPLRRWALAGLTGTVTIAMAALLCFGSYTQRLRVDGQLVPSAGLITVSAPTGGFLARVLVTQGETVHAGQVLAEITGESHAATLGGTMAAVSVDLATKRQALTSSMEVQREISAAHLSADRSQMVALTQQLQQLDQQCAIQTRRISIEKAQLDRWTPMVASGVISSLQMNQATEQWLDAQSQLHALERQRMDLARQLSDAKQAAAQIPLDLERDRQNIQGQLADVSQANAENESKRLVDVVAPRDGVVSALLVQDGQSIATGHAVLNLLPAGSRLQARLLVPSRAMGFIERGGQVVIRYQAYPYQKFGQQYGTVASISRNALDPGELEQITGTTASSHMYLVDVTLQKTSLIAAGTTHDLLPGMALDADILMEKRRLYEWALEPLYGMRQAMRVSAPDHL
jgi:membrane fusion protein